MSCPPAAAPSTSSDLEGIFFPWLESRVKLPPKMSSDHRTLMELMGRVRDLSARLTPQDNVRT